MQLEEMSAFFTARAAEYDAHMLEEVQGCKEGYRRLAEEVPQTASSLLDLGCGTGLELAEIFQRLPGLHVTGIDLTQAMLDRLADKYSQHSLTLLCGDYFSLPFGEEAYDAVISFQTLHHFSHAEKKKLYTKIFRALRPQGLYLECDYMVETQAEEDFYFTENARLRQEQGIPPEAFFHYDTPCTVGNQVRLLHAAGFARAESLWREGNTTLLRAEKTTAEER